MSNFVFFEQYEYERNCSKRISPRRARNYKLLPPECYEAFSSSCHKRISPRRERGIEDCFDSSNSYSDTRKSTGTTNDHNAPQPIRKQSSFNEPIVIINTNTNNNIGNGFQREQ